MLCSPLWITLRDKQKIVTASNNFFKGMFIGIKFWFLQNIYQKQELATAFPEQEFQRKTSY